MKSNGRIRELLAISCLNDHEYGQRVIWPLLDYLGVPSQARRPQFQIENPFGDGLVRIDDDPFCISCARELLTFLHPQHADRLQVFLHNALYQLAPRKSEIDED